LIKKEFPEVTILALTATASLKVVSDVIKVLQMSQCMQFHTGFDRPNLFFEVRPKNPNNAFLLQEMLQYIQQKQPHSTGIVYCMTKRQCEETADFLRDSGLKADYYHAGMSATDRKAVQFAWQEGLVQIVCATIGEGFILLYLFSIFGGNKLLGHVIMICSLWNGHRQG